MFFSLIRRRHPAVKRSALQHACLQLRRKMRALTDVCLIRKCVIRDHINLQLRMRLLNWYFPGEKSAHKFPFRAQTNNPNRMPAESRKRIRRCSAGSFYCSTACHSRQIQFPNWIAIFFFPFSLPFGKAIKENSFLGEKHSAPKKRNLRVVNWRRIIEGSLF